VGGGNNKLIQIQRSETPLEVQETTKLRRDSTSVHRGSARHAETKDPYRFKL
jgi:hypothetical protein